MKVTLLLPYIGVLLAALAWHIGRKRRQERLHAEEHSRNIAAGLNEPATLHPVIDAARCIGSGTCVRDCPEGALGLVGGKAVLINASACIGHGACKPACPFDAISLVFGTAQRGVDIPVLKPNFETNVPGLFIAGELGGMGLIRKAAEQGRQAMANIIRRGRARDERTLDVLIVGAGPAGLSAALSAREQSLRFAVIEQEPSLGGAIFHYPRAKIAMTAPVQLALVGLVRMTEISKEELLTFWRGVTDKHALPIRFGEQMERIEPEGDEFIVRTTKGEHRARSVLLAIGRRGTPRKLEVPGEELPKVTYRLIDPEQYAGQSVLVVGGGDSALEAAVALAETAGTTVTLSYRSGAFSRVKAKNRERLAAMQQSGQLDVRLSSQVQSISADQVLLRLEDGQTLALPNDAVIICAGGVLPTTLLKDIGIAFETKHGTA